MPEIAECRRYVDQLNDLYQGKILERVDVVGGRFVKKGIAGLIQFQHDLPLQLIKFDTKGKFIYASFERDLHMFITLGMAASFGKANKHSAVKFTFETSDVFYNDIRHFGTIKIVRSGAELQAKLKTLGWDALKEPNIPFNIKNHFMASHKSVAALLLNQAVFAGVGNYIRSEVLYRAKVNPFNLGCNLTDSEIERICQNIIDVAKEAYAAGGATIATYNDMYGIAGTYFQNFQVYGQKHDPLGNKVLKGAAEDGRTIHWVKEVQI